MIPAPSSYRSGLSSYHNHGLHACGSARVPLRVRVRHGGGLLHPFRYHTHAASPAFLLQCRAIAPNAVGSATTAMQSVITAAGTIAALTAALVLYDEAQDVNGGFQKTKEVANDVSSADENPTLLYVAVPEGGANNAPVVLVLHEFFGLLQREAELCDELAREGFVAVAVDLFQGRSTRLVPRAIFLAVNSCLRPGATWGQSEVEAGLKHAATLGADVTRAGVIGFCVGGGAAARFAANTGAVRSLGVFYGKPLDDEAQAEALARTKTSVWAAYGGRDNQFSASDVDAYERLLTNASVPEVCFERYPEEGHAFVRDLATVRAGTGAASDAWCSCVAFLKRTLQGVGTGAA